MQLNMRYRNGELDDDLPYVGELKYDQVTGLVYDAELDAVDDETLDALCGGDGKGGDDE